MASKIEMPSGDSKLDLAERIFFRIYQCDNLVHRTSSKALQSHNISSHHWVVLAALSYPGSDKGIKVGDLADLLQVTRQSITPTLNILQKRKLIERVVHRGDARARWVRLTASGEELWLEMRDDINDYLLECLKGFSFDDHITILHFLNRLLANFQHVGQRRNA